MIEALGPGTRLGYCTNVHAGHDLATTLANLTLHAAQVRTNLNADLLGVGLWLAADAAAYAKRRPEQLREHLDALGLRVFTLNGFPFANFHQPVVKHQVYLPDWADPSRLAYTLDLIDILHAIMPEGEEGSISTLPIGWPGPPCPAVDRVVAANHLRAAAARLARLEQATGRLIHLDLEPEPGCILQRADEAVTFWEDVLLHRHSDQEAAIRRHLRLCHDICHTEVVFENQHEALKRYREAGILVGKVQISSAIVLPPAPRTPPQQVQALAELRAFHEPRYLHQTSVSRIGQVTQYEDLHMALDARNSSSPDSTEWRVHFHVPIHLDAVGSLGTTQHSIVPAVAAARASGVRHFEVETYAWTVLPQHLQPQTLADGVAAELRWMIAQAPLLPGPKA